MGTLGYGYGSEWHLLRYLAYHRETLSDSICGLTGADAVRWLDFPFDASRPFGDAEWKGVDFLPPDHPARVHWPDFWPGRGNVQNWDAVGELRIDEGAGWLLVEAKAHLHEVRSSCAAQSNGGRAQIERAMDATKASLGVRNDHDWLTPYYQFANRLAVVSHLREHGVAAHLVNIYFVGDENPAGTCPAAEEDWLPELQRMYERLGLSELHLPYVHRLFLHVSAES